MGDAWREVEHVALQCSKVKDWERWVQWVQWAQRGLGSKRRPNIEYIYQNLRERVGPDGRVSGLRGKGAGEGV